MTKRRALTLVTTALDVVGIVAVAVGTWLIYAPAGYIVAGILLLVLSWRLAS